MRKLTATVALALTALVALACSSGGDDDAPTGSLPADNAAENTDEGTEQTTETDLKSKVTYDDGLVIGISDLERGTSSKYAAPEGNAPIVTFKVTVTNGTEQDVDVTLVQISCKTGPDGNNSEQIYDSSSDINGMDGTIKPGKKGTGVFACEMPKDVTELQIEVQLLDFGRDPAIFTGEIKK